MSFINTGSAPANQPAAAPVGDTSGTPENQPGSGSDFTVVWVIVGIAVLAAAICLLVCAKNVCLRCLSCLCSGCLRCLSCLCSGCLRCLRCSSCFRCLKRNKRTTITTDPSTPIYRSVVNERLDARSVAKLLREVGPLLFSQEQLTGFTANYATRLGSGGFGAVYMGWLPNRVEIAVKVLRRDNSYERIKEQIVAEVGTIGRTHHINLVKLYGFCFEPEFNALVYEYMKNGSLDRYLFDHERHRTNVAALHEIAVGTAKGIKYLHEECERRIIHYDIKPENILLDANLTPKVGDFGLAKLLSRENTHITATGMRGTPGYAAPEMWAPGAPITYKCDVYSFGIMLFEIVRRRRNFEERYSTESQHYWFPREVLRRFSAGRLGELISSLHGVGEGESREKATRMCKVGLLCIQYRPQARPEMSMVVKMLEGEMEVTAPPTNAFHHVMWEEEMEETSSTNL